MAYSFNNMQLKNDGDYIYQYGIVIIANITEYIESLQLSENNYDYNSIEYCVN